MDIPVPAKKPKYFPNIMKCLSAAPSDHMVFMRNVTSMYISDLRPDAAGGRSISRAQIELLATKTSQLNNCAYCTASHGMLLSVVSSEDVSVAIVGGNASVPDADALGRFAVAVCNGVAGDASVDRTTALLRDQLTARLGVAGMLDCAATV